MKKIIFTLLIISLITFFIKSILDIALRWFLVLGEVRESLYGIFSPLGYIKLSFIFHFWAYFLISILLYFVISSFKKLKILALYILSFFIVILICLNDHNYQFPMKQYHFPSKQVFNYILVKEIIVYLVSLFIMIYMLKKTIKK